MKLLELAQELGLDLKKTSNSKGGEYHGACPGCREGENRFMIWPELNRYWCRRCDAKGDAMQFCFDFMNMSYREAFQRMDGASCYHSQHQFKRQVYEPFPLAHEPPKVWKEKASIFLDWAQKQLKQALTVRKELYERGFRDETIIQYKLGYVINPSVGRSKDLFRERSEWGLPCEYKSGGEIKKLWLPSGLLIPTISGDGGVYKLKVRRHEWSPNDPLPKYVEISGSKSCPSIYGDIQNRVAIILESELDSMLIQQDAGDLCCCLALGGSTKKPDFYTDHLLRKFTLVLWCLDNDDAGRKAALWWRETYRHLRFWPVPIGKSPGDALKDHGIDLREWVLRGITKYSGSGSEAQSIDKFQLKEIVNNG